MEDSSGNQIMAKAIPSHSEEKEGCATELGKDGGRWDVVEDV